MWVWALLACREGPEPPTPPAPHTAEPGHTGPTEASFCAVRDVFTTSCTRCHAPDGVEPRLDLRTDPHGAVVDREGQIFGRALVVPGDPEGSLLLAKMEDRQRGSEGTVMPPTGALVDDAAVVRAWIDAGAPDDCGTTTPTTPPRAHPTGFASPGAHGAAVKFPAGPDCRDCHGDDWGGGDSGVSCDACHTPGWRTDCTFCHGGSRSASGAPPQDLDDNDDPATNTFPDHFAHEQGLRSPAYACAACHPDRVDLLEPGHVVDDDDPGEAEVTLASGSYTNRSCSDTACHSDGLDPTTGDITAGAGALGCAGCHAAASSTPAALARMSGSHGGHVASGASCAECHATAASDTAIAVAADHVDGRVQVDLPAGVTADVSRACTGPCHGHDHVGAPW